MVRRSKPSVPRLFVLGKVPEVQLCGISTHSWGRWRTMAPVAA